MIEPLHPEVAIFNAALELPVVERAAFLDEACAGNETLRRQVDSLLEAEQGAGNFLETRPSVQVQRTMVPALPLAEKPGDKIGRYKLLQQIGEGGWGVVYMAEQEEPVRRRVALKVIKVGMDTRSVIARFDVERQALAMMDHPNIARVLDAGATETGRPYFVMELVRGIKITDYCDQHNLATRDRLDLFVQTCRAVQHAHQKGIIHRDLKPSNILVTLHDGVAVPKVIDFGIAKATQGRLTDQTLFTAFEQFIGTPAYMSPEQAEMSGLDIDTRTDIYSLGVLLYELLTGTTPFDQKTLLDAGLEGMRRMIREQDPVRPSTRVSSLRGQERTTTAKHRSADAPKLIHLLRGDLDWIVIKCLEKDRTRRYETANGLGLDIQRHLNNEAVSARKPSRLYRLEKLVRRNKVVFAAGMAVATALLVGLASSLYLLARERQATNRAVASTRAARMEAEKREQLARFLQDMLARTSSQLAQGRDTTKLKEILGQTMARFATDLKGQPAVEAELRASLGNIYYDLGDYAAAEAMDQEALRLKERIGERDTRAVSRLLNHLGNVLLNRNDLDQAEAAQRRALALEDKVSGEGNLGYADPLNDLGLVLWQRGDLAEAEQAIRQALDLKRKLPAEKTELAVTIGNLGLVLWEQGRLPEAERSLSEAMAIMKALLGNHPDVAYSCNNLALVQRDAGNLAEAEALFREVGRLMPRDHPNAARTRSHLAGVLRRRSARSADPALLDEALQLAPADPFTADALAAEFVLPSLLPLSPTGTLAPWRFTNSAPGSNWAAADFTDAAWPAAASLPGLPAYSPRSDRAVPFHTNLWLRREFALPAVPAGKVVLRLNRSHEAEVFLNGVLVAPTADWSDMAVVLPCSEAGRAAFKPGRNLLAVHCGDADGGTLIDAALYLSSDPSLGRIRLLEEFNRLIGKEPERADLYAGRAGVRARLGNWREAVPDLTRAVGLAPRTLDYLHQLAPLLVETADLPGYNRLRREALTQFAEADNPTAAGQVARLCLLTPAEGAELEATLKLANRAASAEYADRGLASRRLAKGLAEYRQGRLTESIDWMGKAQVAAARRDRPGWTHERERNRVAAARLVQAMAYQRLTQGVAARATLTRAIELMQTQMPQPGYGDAGREWPDWLMVQILLREANGLIAGVSAAKAEAH
jgi:serine/threonine protein kinase/tetratricopeptide (TPR) repeat protein